jgi:3-phytase
LKAYNTKDYSYLKTVDSRDQNIVGDPEGVTIYKTSTTEGYVLLSSQGGNEFNVYDRKSLKFIKKFTVNNVQDTDGIDVISKKVNEMFPRGFLVVQDGRNLPENQNFKIVSMDEVLKKKLNHPG